MTAPEPAPGPPPDLRVRIHDHMAEMARLHAAAVYPGVYEGDTAGALFALLTDAAFAYEMEVSADALDDAAVQLGRASGLTPRETLLQGLGENLDLKEDAPAMSPVNGWMMWRLARPEEEAAEPDPSGGGTRRRRERHGEPPGDGEPGEGPARF